MVEMCDPSDQSQLKGAIKSNMVLDRDIGRGNWKDGREKKERLCDDKKMVQRLFRYLRKGQSNGCIE